MRKHILVSESKSLCGRQVVQGNNGECGNCARVAKSRGLVCRVEGMEARGTAVAATELPGVGQWIMWQGFSYMVEARYSDGRMNLMPYGGYNGVIPDRPIAQLMEWGEVKWPNFNCVNCGPRLTPCCIRCTPCDTWGRKTGEPPLETPAKIVTPVIDSQATLTEREAPHRAAFRAFTPTRCNRTYRHELCSVSNCTARLGDCEMCHEVSAGHALTLDGSYVGSSGPRTKNASLYLCAPCYRRTLASVNERGYGSITILWHAQRVIGEAIRYNDPQMTTRYAFLDMDRSDDAWNAAKIKAHQVEPGYAPTINSCLFYSPNANRAYQVTRNGVAGVEYMAPGAAYGLAWEVRHIGRDDTFACAEIDPITGDVVQHIWINHADPITGRTTVTKGF